MILTKYYILGKINVFFYHLWLIFVPITYIDKQDGAMFYFDFVRIVIFEFERFIFSDTKRALSFWRMFLANGIMTMHISKYMFIFLKLMLFNINQSYLKLKYILIQTELAEVWCLLLNYLLPEKIFPFFACWLLGIFFKK